jgi:hypothetical protein
MPANCYSKNRGSEIEILRHPLSEAKDLHLREAKDLHLREAKDLHSHLFRLAPQCWRGRDWRSEEICFAQRKC